MAEERASRAHSRCLRTVQSLVLSSPRLHRLVDEIEALGCPVPEGWIKVRRLAYITSLRLFGDQVRALRRIWSTHER